MFFVEGGSRPHEFERRSGHLWEGLPGQDEVVRSVRNSVPDAMLMLVAIGLPVDRTGEYDAGDAAGTYDGQYLRVWSVSEHYHHEKHGSIEKWLRRYHAACVGLYMDIVHGHAANPSSLPGRLRNPEPVQD